MKMCAILYLLSGVILTMMFGISFRTCKLNRDEELDKLKDDSVGKVAIPMEKPFNGVTETLLTYAIFLLPIYRWVIVYNFSKEK